ncbi:MAG: glycosyl hydrolase family 28 protein [Prolixibacteraceae bacterium]|nr:glycosyl hydrolase family 28 protein [Prolixibacteraceae bacterium]
MRLFLGYFAISWAMLWGLGFSDHRGKNNDSYDPPILQDVHPDKSFVREYNIKEFGAIPDTTILSTKAIQTAIDECSPEGGTVLIPAGNWLSGTLILRSNVTLDLEKGATLYGSRHLGDYPGNVPNYIALRTRGNAKQLIYAENQHNISIVGEGEINGQGRFFADKTAKGVQYDRPHLIQMINCRKIRIENVSLKNSGCWMEHYLACDDLQIIGIKVFNHSNKNNDGIDIDDCHRVTISNVNVDSDDDALCIKSTSGRASEDITVSNCLLSSHCNAFKLGTESNTGFKNIAASNLVIKPSVVSDKFTYGHLEGSSGIALEMVDGGILDGVVISNVNIEGTFTPIFIRLGNRARPYRDGQAVSQVGQLKNVSIDNVMVTGAKNLGCSITGIPGYPVKNISLSNISITFEGGGTKDHVTRPIPELEKEYPEAEMFDMLPAFGFFIRHAENIRFSNVHLNTKKEDLRPALYLSDVNDADFGNLNLGSDPNNICAVFAEGVSNIGFNSCRIRRGSTCFLHLSGNSNRNLTLFNNVLTNTKIVFNPGATNKKEIHAIGNVR